MRNVLLEMEVRRARLAKQKERDPRVTMTKLIFMQTEQTVEEAIAELMVDLVPRFIAEELVSSWALDKAIETRRAA